VSKAAKDFSKELSSSSLEGAGSGKQFSINGKTIIEDRLLSEGGFGYVYLARDAQTNQQYVLKKILCMDKDRLDLALREVEIFEKLPINENLVRYYGHTIQKEPRSREVVILMEFCPGGHLYDLMKSHPNGVPTNKIIKALLDISKGLKALGEMEPSVQHRDLKLENVLMSKAGNYVLVDFGSWSSDAPNLANLSRTELMQFGDIVERYTTLMYRPPEMADLYKGFTVSTKVDIWMLGCILFTLINNRHPFQDASNLAIVNCRYSHDLDQCKKHPPKLVDLCGWLLAQNPSDRPSASTLVSILSEWDSNVSEPFSLPQAVIERIEKDNKLYGIPTGGPTQTNRRRESRRSSTGSSYAAPVVNVWTDSPGVAQKGEWKADFGNLIDFDSAPPALPTSKLSEPQAASQTSSPYIQQDLLG